MKPSIDEMLREHIPYRLTHLDGLVWASEKLLASYRPTVISIQFDGQVALVPTSLYQITNPLFEIGILYCRVLLDFLGIQLDRKNKMLAGRTGRRSDDFGIEQLSLPYVTVPQLLGAPCARSGDVEAATIATLVSADKGIAHFTSGKSGRAYVEDSLLCAKAVAWCVEEYVYRKQNIPISDYKRWTAPDEERAP